MCVKLVILPNKIRRNQVTNPNNLLTFVATLFNLESDEAKLAEHQR